VHFLADEKEAKQRDVLVCFHFSLVSFPSSFAQLPIGSEVGKTDIGCVYRVHIVTRKIVGAPG